MTVAKNIIISSEADYHACAVRWGLSSMGSDCAIYDTTRSVVYNDNSSYIKLDEGATTFGSNIFFEQTHPASIWGRRFHVPRRDPQLSANVSRYVGTENAEFQANFLHFLEDLGDVNWVNKLSSVRKAELKMHQLLCAKKLGLTIPDTLVTAGAANVRDFSRSHKKMVVKPFNPHSWVDEGVKKRYVSFANLISSSQLDHFKDSELSVAPVIYQEYIETVSDIRVAIIGGRVFPLEMRHIVDGKIDFRLMDESELQCRPFEFPKDVEHSLLSLMNHLDVQVASADFILTKEGKLVFIELNPSGAFLFLEQRCPEIKVLAAICSFLEFGTVRVDASSIFPSLRDFEASADYGRWGVSKCKFDQIYRAHSNITNLDREGKTE